jgi:hypothetical protein
VGQPWTHQPGEGRVVAGAARHHDGYFSGLGRRRPDDTSGHAADQLGMRGDETVENLVGERGRVVEQVSHRTGSGTSTAA